MPVVFILVIAGVARTPGSAGLRSFSKPDLSFRLSFSAKDRFPLQRLRLRVIAPARTIAWQYDVQGLEEIDALLKQDTLVAESWYEAAGNYVVEVSYSLDEAPDKLTTEEQEFRVSGQELRIITSLCFIDDDEKKPALLADLTTRRLLRSPGGVLLFEDWLPSPNGKPRYEIVNDTDWCRHRKQLL
jgi:hypothetical protein